MAQEFEVSPLKGTTFAARMDGLDLPSTWMAVDVARNCREASTSNQVLSLPGVRGTSGLRTDQVLASRTSLETSWFRRIFFSTGTQRSFVRRTSVENGQADRGGRLCADPGLRLLVHRGSPRMASVLHGVEKPPGGGPTTSLASMYQPYEALKWMILRMGRIEGKRAIHDYLRLQQFQFPDRPLTEEQKRKTPPVAHPIAPRHPVTGRRSLFLGGAVIAGVEGMPEHEGLALMDDLRAFATPAAVRLRAPLERRRHRHVGQQMHAAPRQSIRRGEVQASDASHHGRRASGTRVLIGEHPLSQPQSQRHDDPHGPRPKRAASSGRGRRSVG